MSILSYSSSLTTQLVDFLFKLDDAAILKFFFFAATLSTIFHYARGFLYALAQRTILCSVRIEDECLAYLWLRRWVAETQLSGYQGSLQAQVPSSMSLEDEQLAVSQTQELMKGKIDDQSMYRALVSSRPIRFVPYTGQRLLRYRGHFIMLRQTEWKEMQGGNSPRPRFFVTLECLGRSPRVIEDLLHTAQLYYHTKATSCTTVHRAHFGASGERAHWTQVVSRQSRAIDSVILERGKKDALLADITEYLQPHTRRWYLEHGIPYRRGFLFSGPPGTGKSSLTSALAGTFGLEIYTLSLLEPSNSESKLSSLLSVLPTRCILLLEDIDAAGLGRSSEIVKRDEVGPRSNISLSGLLNAIDGVTSPEGRILIMTTNHPQLLDSALIRPGRVDMHITFELPSSVQVQELFLSIYRSSEATEENDSVDTKRQSGAKSPHGVDNAALARDFAAVLCEKGNRFSLAAIQGYLLRHKRDPAAAVAGAKYWLEERQPGV